MSSSVDAVLFDMDGVVLEGRGTDPSVYARAADAAIDAMNVDPPDRHRRGLGKYDYSAVESHCGKLGIDPVAFWRSRESHASRIANDGLRSGQRGLYDDVATIRKLDTPSTLALVSNNRAETVSFVADHFSLPFAAVRGRDPTPDGFRRRKPDPTYLLETLSSLGAETGIYVGDRDTDVLAAERAGLEPAYLRRSHNADEPLPSGTTYELESLSDLRPIL